MLTTGVCLQIFPDPGCPFPAVLRSAHHFAHVSLVFAQQNRCPGCFRGHCIDVLFISLRFLWCSTNAHVFCSVRILLRFGHFRCVICGVPVTGSWSFSWRVLWCPGNFRCVFVGVPVISAAFSFVSRLFPHFRCVSIIIPPSAEGSEGRITDACQGVHLSRGGGGSDSPGLLTR